MSQTFRTPDHWVGPVRVKYTTRLQIVPESKRVDFDLLDRKSRALGYRWTIDAVDVRLATDTDNGVYMQKPELAAASFLYRLDYSVTRNGKDYGAGQSFSYFLSADAARAAVTKKAEGARKRYARLPQEKR